MNNTPIPPKMSVPMGASREVGINEMADIYRAMFDQICNKEDWKAPFSAWVPWSMANVYMDSIEFMCGVRPTAGPRVDGKPFAKCFLSCIGYNAGPCGDH